MDPFFTVIIPTCQRHEELNRAVCSVISQTLKDFELIIVNNGDDELNIAVKDERIKILPEKRKGANYARNTGIENSQGQFICFLDDDDIYLNNHLATLYNLIKGHSGKAAMYRTYTKIEKVKGEFVDQPIVMKHLDQTSLDHIFSVLLFMACVCCHRDVLKEIKFDPLIPVAQDYHLWSRILVKYPLIEIPIITTVYNKTNNSISSPSLEAYQNYIKVYGDLFKKDVFIKGITRKTRKNKS